LGKDLGGAGAGSAVRVAGVSPRPVRPRRAAGPLVPDRSGTPPTHARVPNEGSRLDVGAYDARRTGGTVAPLGAGEVPVRTGRSPCVAASAAHRGGGLRLHARPRAAAALFD